MHPFFTASYRPASRCRYAGSLLAGLLLAAGTARAQAPTVTSVSPARSAVAAPRATAVAVGFSQALANSAATQGALKVFSQQAGGLKAGTATVSGNTLRFQPAAAFKAGETVSATVTTAAQSSGGAAALPQVFQFTTATAPSPGTFDGGSDQALSNGQDAAVGDVNGDGFPDLLFIDQVNTASEIAHTVTVRLNDGHGTFGSARAVDVGLAPVSLALGDMDDDGDLDLVIGVSFQNKPAITVALNDGAGNFGSPQSYSNYGAPQSLVLGDINGDGYLDVVASNATNSSFTSFINNRKGGLVIVNRPSSDAYVYGMALGDIDGDGALDLLTAGALSGGQVYVFTNNGQGVFSQSATVVTGTAADNGSQSVAVGDVNGDGFLDFVAKQQGNHVSVRLNDGHGNFSGSQEVPAAGNGGMRGVALADVNGDGFLDLLAANSEKGTVSIRLNDGKGVFSGSSEATAGAGAANLALADFNGDGTLDLATQGYQAVSVRLNQPQPATPPMTAATRLHAGGGALATTRGPFAADQYFSASSAAFTTKAPVAGTPDPALYQTERFSTHGALSYAVPVANGQYAVVLHFAELYWTKPGQRVFDATLEGTKVLDHYDIVKKVGPLTATTETFTVAVTDGVLNLDLTVPYLTGGADQAKLSALEVLPVLPAAYRLNAGGGSLPTTRGPFAADRYYSAASRTFATTALVAGTPDPALYQTERYGTNGTLAYALPVANGTYSVVLHFAEIYWTQPGQRVFDAALEGTKVLDHYDIIKKVGALTATTETFPVTVTDGVLNLDLSVPYLTGGKDQPKLSAIEVLPAPPAAQAARRGALAEATPQSPIPLGASVYPNPSTGRFTLACTAAAAQAATLLLTDELGRVVHQQRVQLQAGPNALAVRADGATPGLYQLVLRTADGQSQRQKVLIRP